MTDIARNADNPNHPIVLIGYRGTGKTSVAQELSSRWGWPTFDSDVEVERRAGCTIAEMFSKQGETAFRDLEEEVIADLLLQAPAILSLGGGAILRKGTRDRIRAASTVVWLTASPETIASRILGDPTTATRRPNLTLQGGLAEIEQVLANRQPIYAESAHFSVDTEGLTPAEIAQGIEQFCRPKA